MTRALLALALALAFLPALASAQFVERPGIIIGEPMPGPGFIYAELRLETPRPEIMPVQSPWLAVGYDNVVNLTVHNNGAEGLNATFRINVTGAVATPAELVFSLDPYEREGRTFSLHPDDVGLVEVRAEAIDAFQAGGEPLRADLVAPAFLLPSARFVDPPAVATASEEDEFQQIDGYRGVREGLSAYVRIRPGDAVVPRIELTNPFEAATPAFRLTIEAPVATGLYSESVEVAAIEPGASRIVEFPEYQPIDESGFGGGYFGGPMGSFELRPIAFFEIGGQPLSAGLTSFRLESGAVQAVAPSVAVIDVQDGVAVDLMVPRKPVLGTPTRILYNLTNLQTTPAQGRLTLQILTPNGLFYEVQGPETHQVALSLGPGERATGSIDFTPRVTGPWSVSTVFRSGSMFGYGGGGGFEVKGPLVLGFDTQEQLFSRIGEPVEVGISLATTETLQDAQLRVSAGGQYWRDPSGMEGSDHRPGFADTLIDSRSPTSSLGTLRPGGSVNASVEVIGRSSGYYSIVPYVVAEGFAYTSTPSSEPGRPPMPFEQQYYATVLGLLVQPRPVPAALSMAPLVLGLAFFVGAWTLRTRFVK